MNPQIIVYAIQGIQLALRLLAAGKEANTVLQTTADALKLMQSEGNRAPTDEEWAAQNALLDQLAADPHQY